MEKQQQDQVDRDIKAHEKLEMEMEAARHEHPGHANEAGLDEASKNFGWKGCTIQVQKAAQLELRPRRNAGRHEEEMRQQQEEMMRPQQEGFKGTFPDEERQEIGWVRCLWEVLQA